MTVLQPSSNLGRSMAVGAAWMVLLRIADRGIGLISLAVLARLLLPEDFGLIALALSLIAIVEMFGEFGVELALIKNQQAERPHYDTAWTLNIITALVLAGVLFMLAAPGAAFFAEPRIEAIIRWLALANVIAALANIGVVDFRKHLEFNREFRWLFSSRVIGTAIALTLAFLWRDYWALVAGTLAQAVVRAGLSYAVHDYRPRLSLAAFGDIFHFSKWVLVQNVIHGVNDRAAALVIGRLANANVLAHYTIAYEISSMATTELAAPIRRAVFPGFAKMASDVAVLRDGFIKTFSVMVLIGLPIPLGIALTAPLIVPVFLGEKWLAAIPLIQVLSLFGVVRSLGMSSQLVYLAVGKPRITAQLSALRLVLLLPLLVWGTTKAGAVGAAWAMVITSVVLWGVDFAILLRVLQFNMRALLANVWRTLVAALVMVFAIYFFPSSLPAPQSLADYVLQLAASIGLGAAVYCGTALLLWRLSNRPPGAESMVLAVIQARRSPL